jgi:hypothetical protein
VDRPTPPARRARAGARVINDELQQVLTGASVRTEAFITLVVPESRLGKAAKEAGRGIEGRAQVLYSQMAESKPSSRGGRDAPASPG